MIEGKSILVFAAGVFVIVFPASAFAGTYSGGTGEPNDPYLIATAEDLNDIGNHIEDFNKCFLMVADINLADYTGSQFNIIGDDIKQFTGVFDGNDYSVSNLELDANVTLVGLFGFIGLDGVVQNTCLKTINIKGPYSVGGIVGRSMGLIQNCHVFGKIEGEHACGGIAGCAGRIRDCSFSGQVYGTTRIGGIVGLSGYEITGCYAIVEIIGEGSCGGIIGHNEGGNFKSCFARGSVTCSQHTAGGFVGLTYDYCGFGGDIHDCYADVIINCSKIAGAFSGSKPGRGEIRNCYCSGKVIYDVNDYEEVGGFIGEDYYPSDVLNCYFLETAGPNNGFGEPLSKEQMQMQSTFTDAGWDFIEIWNIGENQTYPFLRKLPTGDIDHDDIVNFYDVAIMADHWLQGTQ